MKRIGGWILAVGAAGALGCGFPPVPKGSGSQVEKRGSDFAPATPEEPPRYGIGAEEADIAAPEQLGRPHEIEGLLVSNAVSSYVIQTGPTSWVTLQATPQTMLRIGDVEAGLREIQPGSEVRAMAVPTGAGNLELAVEVVAEPGQVGWRSTRGQQQRPAR